MLMKDVSFWCVVLAIVIIFVVHHILSSFKVIEGLDEEIPPLVNQDLQNPDAEPETVRNGSRNQKQLKDEDEMMNQLM